MTLIDDHNTQNHHQIDSNNNQRKQQYQEAICISYNKLGIIDETNAIKKNGSKDQCTIPSNESAPSKLPSSSIKIPSRKAILIKV